MCDYSLYATQNRLATDGEQLALHRFESGSIGFASVCDLAAEASRRSKKTGFWEYLKEVLFSEHFVRVPAVCIPPGARLLLTEVPQSTQAALQIGACEEVVFTELSSRSYRFRDALILPNKTQVLLQDLSEGTRATVLSLGSEEEMEISVEEMSHWA